MSNLLNSVQSCRVVLKNGQEAVNSYLICDDSVRFITVNGRDEELKCPKSNPNPNHITNPNLKQIVN